MNEVTPGVRQDAGRRARVSPYRVRLSLIFALCAFAYALGAAVDPYAAQFATQPQESRFAHPEAALDFAMIQPKLW